MRQFKFFDYTHCFLVAQYYYYLLQPFAISCAGISTGKISQKVTLVNVLIFHFHFTVLFFLRAFLWLTPVCSHWLVLYKGTVLSSSKNLVVHQFCLGSGPQECWLDCNKFEKVPNSLSINAASEGQNQLPNFALSPWRLHPNHRKNPIPRLMLIKHVECLSWVLRWSAFVWTVCFSYILQHFIQYRYFLYKIRILNISLILTVSFDWHFIDVNVLLLKRLLHYTCNLTDKEFKINRYWNGTYWNMLIR